MIVNKYTKGNGGGGSGSTYSAGDYIQIQNDVISVTGITPSEYLTTADTQDFVTEADITAATSPIQEQVDDIERVTATALTELHDSILELSGATSGYATEAYVDAAITSATQDFVTEEDLTGYTSQQDFEDFQDSIEEKEEVIASALTELDETKVESSDVHTMVKIAQAGYDALVSGGTVDEYTFYIITGSTGN